MAERKSEVQAALEYLSSIPERTPEQKATSELIDKLLMGDSQALKEADRDILERSAMYLAGFAASKGLR